MLSMPLITLVTGGLLIGCGLIGAVASGLRDLEVMVACLFGGLLLVTGFLAREGDLRKLSMHLAAVLGLIGAIASLALLIRAKPDVSKAAVIIHTITMILCAEYVALCIASFVKARKAMAEKGDRVAQFNLGGMYYNGQGVGQDYATAYSWANIAQANGEKMLKK